MLYTYCILITYRFLRFKISMYVFSYSLFMYNLYMEIYNECNKLQQLLYLDMQLQGIKV